MTLKAWATDLNGCELTLRSEADTFAVDCDRFFPVPDLVKDGG